MTNTQPIKENFYKYNEINPGLIFTRYYPNSIKLNDNVLCIAVSFHNNHKNIKYIELKNIYKSTNNKIYRAVSIIYNESINNFKKKKLPCTEAYPVENKYYTAQATFTKTHKVFTIKSNTNYLYPSTLIKSIINSLPNNIKAFDNNEYKKSHHNYYYTRYKLETYYVGNFNTTINFKETLEYFLKKEIFFLMDWVPMGTCINFIYDIKNNSVMVQGKGVQYTDYIIYFFDNTFNFNESIIRPLSGISKLENNYKNKNKKSIATAENNENSNMTMRNAIYSNNNNNLKNNLREIREKLVLQSTTNGPNARNPNTNKSRTNI